MAPVVIQLQKAEDPRDVVHRAVQALAEGKIVALPTETVYNLAVSALNEDAVRRLRRLQNGAGQPRVSLAIKSGDDALDYVPHMTALQRRLARRCWPGPVTLVLDADHPDSLLRQLPSEAQQWAAPEHQLALRVPAHSAVLSALRLMPGPLVLADVGIGGEGAEQAAVSAEEVISAVGDRIDLVLDDGRSKFGQPASVVRVSGRQLEVMRPGVSSEGALKRLADFVVLMVCTGNTCRSPMAELLMRHRLAERLGCQIDELEDRGVLIMSAGIAAMVGGRGAAEAVQIMKERGLDLSHHESQPLTERLVRYADLVITMTAGHREAIISQWPDTEPRVHVLCHDGGDVSDPIGGPPEMYRRCAEQIDGQLEVWIDKIDFDSIPQR